MPQKVVHGVQCICERRTCSMRWSLKEVVVTDPDTELVLAKSLGIIYRMVSYFQSDLITCKTKHESRWGLTVTLHVICVNVAINGPLILRGKFS